MRPVYVTQKAILIREDGALLALRRSASCPRRPLTWDLPGGEVEFGEDLVAGIVREVREETGIVISEPILFDAIGSVTSEKEYWTSLGYFAHVPQASEVQLSFEHDKHEWISRKEFLERESTPRIKRFLGRAPVPEAHV